MSDRSVFDPVEEAIAAIAAGQLVIVADDEDRENEGDLIMAAEKATPETINMMIRYGSGIVCVPMTGAWLDRLGLGPMVARNREVQRTVNQIEASFYNRMERVGGYRGKANQMNAYYMATGDPDWFNEDLARYRAISPTDVSAAAAAFLPLGRRVELTVTPEAK